MRESVEYLGVLQQYLPNKVVELKQHKDTARHSAKEIKDGNKKAFFLDNGVPNCLHFVFRLWHQVNHT